MPILRDGNLQQIRNRAIDGYKDALASVERTDAPGWMITLLVTPLFVWETFKVSLRIWLGGLVAILSLLFNVLMVPVITVVVWLDTLLIVRWFFARIVDKMKGEQQ